METKRVKCDICGGDHQGLLARVEFYTDHCQSLRWHTITVCDTCFNKYGADLETLYKETIPEEFEPKEMK